MKRIISFVLCLSMLLSLVPVTAFAADVEQTTAATEAALTVESTGTTEAPAEEPADIPETTGATEDTIPETTAVTEAAETVETTVPEVTEAYPPEETVPEETEEVLTAEVLTWVPDMDLPSDEELFAGYVEQQFYGTGISTFGTAGRETLDEGHQAIYDALATQIRKIASGDLGSTVIAVGENLGDVSVTLQLQSTGEIITVTCPCDTTYSEKEVDVSNVDLDLQALLNVLLADLPYELYWFDKTSGVSVIPVGNCYVFYFAISSDYRANALSGEYYNTADYEVDQALTGAAAAAAENAQEIVNGYLDQSDYGKLLGYMTEIRSLTGYNYDAVNDDWDYGDPWQLIWVFDGDPDTKVVCEGYSKAFQYLCDQSTFANDILCYSVVGYLDPSAPGYGAHMWNILSVNEGNYLVDVTNTSTSGSLFLKGGTIRKGVYYYDYDAGKYASNTEADGTYIINSHTFVYDQETIDLWGMDILTLAAESLTEANFPEAPKETEPSEPETEPTEPEQPTAMTGEELAAALEALSGTNYTLEKPVVISSDITLPSGYYLILTAPASITVKDGATLTLESTIAMSDGGTLTVEEGGVIEINEGSLYINEGCTVTVAGSMTHSAGNISVNGGILTVTGSYIRTYGYLQKDMAGTITGIACTDINLEARVATEAELLAAMNTEQAYNSRQIILWNGEDGSVSTITLRESLTIEDNTNWTLGYNSQPIELVLAGGVTVTIEGSITIPYTGTLVTVGSGATLINNGYIGLNYNINGSGTLTIAAGGTLINNSTINNNGTIRLYGEFENNGDLTGNAPIDAAIAAWEEFLEDVNDGGDVNLYDTVTLAEDLSVTLSGSTLYIHEDAKLIVPADTTLTLNSAASIRGTLLVEEGGVLTITTNGTIQTGSGAVIEMNGTAEGRAVIDLTGASMTIGGTMVQNYPLTVNQGSSLTVAEGGELTTNGNLLNFGTTVVDGTLNVNGACSTGNSMAADGYANNCAALKINGTLAAGESSSLGVLKGGSLQCFGYLESSGRVFVNSGAVMWVGGEAVLSGTLTNYNDIQIGNETEVATLALGSTPTLTLNGTTVNYGHLEVCSQGQLNVSGTLSAASAEGCAGQFDIHGSVYVDGTLNVTGGSAEILGGGLLCNDGAMTLSDGAAVMLYGSLSGSGELVNNGLLHIGEKDSCTGDTGYYSGDYTQSETGHLEVETFLGTPLPCGLSPTAQQELIHSGSEYVTQTLAYAEDYASVRIDFTGDVPEDSLGYVLMPDDADLLTIHKNVTLNICTTVFIPDITVENYGTLNVGTGELPGELILCGTLYNMADSLMTVCDGSSMTVDSSGTVNNDSAVTVGGVLVVNGVWEGDLPTAVGNGIVDTENMSDAQDVFENMLTGVDSAILTYDLELLRSLKLECTLVIGEGVTLTVPEGVTLLNNGQILLEDGAALVVEGALTGRLPALMGTSAVFDYTDGIVNFTQTDLDAQLREGNGPVHVSIPLTLNKDLTVPAGAQLILSGDGSITIPAERTLTNNGLILLQYPTEDTYGITAVDGGILANNGTIRNEGSMDLSDGVYTCTEGAELILAYLNQGEGTGILSELLCGENMELYQQVTMLVEGWHEAQMRHVLNLAAINQPKALLINLCGVMELNTAWYGTTLDLPEYATLSINAALTLPSGYTLTNGGQIEIGAGGTLTVKSGAVLEGNLPVCLEGGQYINENTTTLTGTLDASTTLTGPTEITGTLEIPSGVILTISGGSASLVLAEGAVLTNSGTINVENSGILDVTQGTYVNNGGTVNRKFRCDADGNITYATVQGIQLGDMVITAETYSGDQVIREAIDYVNSLIENGEAPEEDWISILSIRFCGSTTLSADLELPYRSDPIITGIGSLTVPEGMTLTDHSGMRVAGTLTANGQVIATGFPIMVDSVECLVNPENCTNFYYDNLTLEHITVTPSQTTACIGQSIELKLDGWYPANARYFGDYEVSFDLADFKGYGWNEAGNLVVYTDDERGACDVTVTITATNEYGEVLTNSAGEDISESVTLHFVEKRFYLYITEAPDFYEDVNNGICGLYPGSSLTFYANTTGVPGEVDENVDWPDYTQFGDYISTSVDGGMLTVTVSEALSSTEVIEIRPMIDDSSVADYSEPLYLRPRATSVDIVMNEQIVSGETVLYDMNRNPNSNSVELMPLASPDASYNSHLTSGRKQLVQWKSSNVNIAGVDQDTGVVTFHKPGKVKITMTANFGSKQTATMTFNVVALEQEILPSEKNAAALIGGSSATYTVINKDGAVLKSSAVRWFLCDKDGNPIDSHPYASITAAGKLTTKAVADEINVYLMAQVVGDENSACLSEPVLVELYPAVSSAQILVGTTPISGTLLYDIGTLGDLYPLSWTAGPYLEAVKNISWKSSAPKVAEIDANTGLIQVLKPGTAKFTLTVTALNNKKTTASVTLKFGTFTQDLSLSALLPDSNEVTDDLNGLEIYSGQSITFYAENLPGDVTTSGVKWSVDNKSYATISSKGVLKAKTVVNPVIVTVRADSKDGACGYDIPVIILPKSTAVIIWNEDGEFIAKTTQTLEIGESIQLEASEDVTWTSSKPSVAAVDDDGFVTAQSAGSTTITAATADKRKVTFTLKVTKPFQSISITTKNNVPFTVASGKSLNLVGTVEYEDGSRNTKVTWSVSDSSLATISSSGKLTAAKGLTTPATVYVTATAKDSTWSASKPVQLLPLTTGVEVFGPFGTGIYNVDISNTTQKWDLTTREDSFSLSARTFPEDAMDVTWKSSNAKVASVDPGSGEVKCLKAGTVTITATAGDGSGKKATFKLTVHRTMREDSLTLPETAIIGGGKSLTLTKLEGYGIDDEATSKALAWTLTYPNGAAVPKTVASISSKGVLSTKKVTAPLTLCIKAVATDGSGCADSCFVTIYPVTTKVSIVNAPATIPVNTTVTLTAEATPAAGADQFTWKSSNSAIASVDANTGTVTAHKPGSVSITATARDGSNKKASVLIRVVPKVTITNAPVQLQLNDTADLEAEYAPFNSAVSITWTSSDPGIVYVHEQTGFIQANHTGTATITATASDGTTASAEVKVVPVTFSVHVETLNEYGGTVSGGTRTFTTSEPYLLDALLNEGFVQGEYETYSDGTGTHTSFRTISVNGISSEESNIRFQWWCCINGEEYADIHLLKIVPGGYYEFLPYQD